MSYAILARSFVSFAAIISRISLEMPEIPNKPDCFWKIFNISLISVISNFFIKNGMIEASISPVRVPIVTPAKGVNPIEVSTALPPSTAVIDAPLPK